MTLVVNADDFGLCSEVNQAVELAHSQGILTATSLMVGESGVNEALQIAKKNPTLAVGLHLTLVEGHSVLPHKEIPDLVDERGCFLDGVVWSGIRYFFSKKQQIQIERECEAQIEKFLKAGLKLDHINSHNHLHLHPIIADIVIQLAKKYSIPWVRLPLEPKRGGLVSFFAKRLRKKLMRANIAHNDFIFGLSDTGRMTKEVWLKILNRIPRGFVEIYTHPATLSSAVLKRTMPGYRHKEESEALLDPEIKQHLQRLGFQLTK